MKIRTDYKNKIYNISDKKIIKKINFRKKNNNQKILAFSK